MDCNNSNSVFYCTVNSSDCSILPKSNFKIADKMKNYEYITLLALTIPFDLMFENKYNFGFIKTLISCLFFLKLSSSFIKHQNLYGKLKYLAGYSFFLYAVHTPFLGTSINKISQKIIPLHGILCLVQFLLASFLTIVFGTIFGILLNKICSPAFSLLNGGRKQFLISDLDYVIFQSVVSPTPKWNP